MIYSDYIWQAAFSSGKAGVSSKAPRRAPPDLPSDLGKIPFHTKTALECRVVKNDRSWHFPRYNITIKISRITFTSMYSAQFLGSSRKTSSEGPNAAAYTRSHLRSRLVFSRTLLYVPCVHVYSRLVLNRGGIWCMGLLRGRFFRGGAKRPLFWLCKRSNNSAPGAGLEVF